MKKLSTSKTNRASAWTGKVCATILAGMFATATFGQGVGINTTTPDPSAALDIQSTDKGILIPRVSLQSHVDNATVPNPANGLLIYNTNPDGVDGVGFYYNLGTPASPNWTSLNEFILPVNKSVSTKSGQSAFSISNFSQSSSASAIQAFSQAGYALIADGMVKISGNGQLPGSGKVLTSDASGNASWEGGVAFKVVGVKGDGGNVVAPNTNYKIPFATEQYDKSNSYNLFSQSDPSTFIAPVRGIYQFTTQVGFSVAIDYSIFLDLRLERAGSVSVVASSNGGEGVKNISSDLILEEGDKVFVTCKHTGDGNKSIDHDANKSFFSGHFVQSIK